MKLSTQEEYGLRCLVQLGLAGTDAFLTLAELSRREAMTLPNVAKIMRLLRRSGFVKATRGHAGGYALARPPQEISVGDVLAALGGRLFDPQFCERHAGSVQQCLHLSDCSVRPVWRLLQRAVDDVLQQLTLKDLLCGDSLAPQAGPGLHSVPVRFVAAARR